jgi:PAS domain S-box-containing protein
MGELGADHYRRVFEDAPVAIAFFTLDGEIWRVNRRFVETFGYTREEIRSVHEWWNRVYPDPQVRAGVIATSREMFEAARDGSAIGPREREISHKDGRRLVGLLSGSRVGDVMMVSFVDITAAKRAEEAQRELDEQLRHANKLEALGTLAAAVAHDLNNLLTVLLGVSELRMLDPTTPHDVREDMEQVRAVTQRAGALTRHLLVFSGRRRARPELVDVAAFVLSTEKLLHRFVSSTVAIEATVSDATWARVDPVELEQILVNLVVNARDAMPKGGLLSLGVSEARVHERGARDSADAAPPGRWAQITVSDTGVGMPPEALQRIFEPFFTTKATGTGLGLATVGRLVREMEGHVRVRSTVGVGTTFTVYLPLLEAGTRGVIEPEEDEASPLRGRSETILIVDEDDDVRATLKRTLVRFGYRVLEARNAGEALLWCERTPDAIDLLLADDAMSLMSGTQLAARVRAQRPNQRVLVTSGDAARAFPSADEDHVLAKPYRPHDLLRAIRRTLDGGTRSGGGE